MLVMRARSPCVAPHHWSKYSLNKMPTPPSRFLTKLTTCWRQVQPAIARVRQQSPAHFGCLVFISRASKKRSVPHHASCHRAALSGACDSGAPRPRMLLRCCFLQQSLRDAAADRTPISRGGSGECGPVHGDLWRVFSTASISSCLVLGRKRLGSWGRCAARCSGRGL